MYPSKADLINEIREYRHIFRNDWFQINLTNADYIIFVKSLDFEKLVQLLSPLHMVTNFEQQKNIDKLGKLSSI